MRICTTNNVGNPCFPPTPRVLANQPGFVFNVWHVFCKTSASMQSLSLWQHTIDALQVTSAVNNLIMGKMYVEHTGIMRINNTGSGMVAKIKFKEAGRLSSKDAHGVRHVYSSLLMPACCRQILPKFTNSPLTRDSALACIELCMFWGSSQLCFDVCL